ncbi:MAG: xanthine dehydrogenase family protein molybdopterin-binding subunit [Gammaproteobacteria bacterium]|nr:xanthine dehydrogenase family protein molybdopterin-binding subunit [Gammaproteobacteria bacterium]
MARSVGASLKRVEDHALVTGRGRFVDDIHLPDALHAAMVRAPYAHARITGIDAAAALALDGVHAVLSARDLPAELRERPIPLLQPNPAIRHPRTPYALAGDEVCHVGEPVAVVLAADRYVAEDAVELVEVGYEPLPVVADAEKALGDGASAVHAGLEDNLAADLRLGYGDVDAAFAGAAHVVEESFFQHRGSAHPIECRAVLARHDAATGVMTVWCNTQSPHQYKGAYADVMGLPEHRVHVIAPDVGGGFGPKTILYPEQFSIPACALVCGRPVKWTEDRHEHFLTAYQERDQHWRGRLALDGDGRILGLEVDLLHDIGAYLPWGIVQPYISSVTVPGPYLVPAYRIRTRVAMTNKVPVTPVRGAGRPQAAFFMERMMDRAAERVGVDREAIRRRNFVLPEQMPYEVGLLFRDGRPIVYDSGDYPRCHESAIARSGYRDFERRRREARAEGRWIGIGTASYVEATGLGPYEGVNVHLQRNGKVVVHTGAAPQGQGHQTMLAQVCADALGVPFEDVTVNCADTVTIQRGIGTFASRIVPNAAPSAHLAACAVKEQVKKVAAHMLEAAEVDLEVENGRAFVRGVPEHGATLAEIATFANGLPGFAVPAGLPAVMEETVYFTPERATYANGTHVVTVEVDVETGKVTILDYVTTHDCGTMINPMMVEGQVMGGVAHGIGNALFERMLYDDSAQPLTVSFGEYLLPGALDVPNVSQAHIESPTPLNPVGAKGAGEGGTIPAIAAIVSAVEDALAPLGVRINEAPITPERVLALIDAARARLNRRA